MIPAQDLGDLCLLAGQLGGRDDVTGADRYEHQLRVVHTVLMAAVQKGKTILDFILKYFCCNHATSTKKLFNTKII